MVEWLIVGSSPNNNIRDVNFDASITCNAGENALRGPMYYLVEDLTYNYERTHYPWKALTVARQCVANHIGLNPDILLGDQDWGATSGLMCVQFALRMKADVLHLVGFEGYRSTEDKQVVDYFDGRIGAPIGTEQTAWQCAELTRMCLAYPNVQFHAYGDLAYNVEAENWSPHA